jgi:hypothetical protein
MQRMPTALLFAIGKEERVIEVSAPAHAAWGTIAADHHYA